MAKTVPIISFLIIICANHSFCANLYNNIDQEFNSDQFKQLNALFSRRMDVDRQALAAFLFSLPALPALLMAPLAVAGIRPTIGAVGQFMNSVNTGNSIAQGIVSLLQSPPSASDSTSSSSNSVSSTSGSGSSGSSSPFTSALRSISEMIFNRRFSNVYINRFAPKPQNNPTESSTDTKPNTESGESAQNRIETIMSSLREVYGILRNGLRRYEITDTDCQSRIICELHQKAVGRSASLGSLTSQMLDLIGIESHLDRSNAVSDSAKSFIKDFVRAAKTGLKNNDCSSTFSRCPSAPDSPQFNTKINALNSDYFKSKPNIYDFHQLLQTKLSPNKANRHKSTFLTTPPALNYYYNL